MKQEWPERRKSIQISVGGVLVGGDAPISVQSMTNTETEDVEATVNQIAQLTAAGADIVRVSVPTTEAARSLKKIRSRVKVPIVADIHYDYRIAIKVADLGVDCLRINPGNIGRQGKIRSVIDACVENNIPIRIGVNAGSLEKDLQKKFGEPTPEALVESALRQADLLDKFNFSNFKLSLKASEIFMTVRAYQLIAKQIDKPLHLGITEAGGLRSGTVKSAAGLGMLLAEGIGDTIRVSLSADPVEEVRVGFDLLRALKLRSRGINFISCPSCSRQTFDVIKTMNQLETRLEDVTTSMNVAIMGCVVNGPGEAREADLGLTGGNKEKLALFIDGRPVERLPGNDFLDRLEEVIREKAVVKEKENMSLIKIKSEGF